MRIVGHRGFPERFPENTLESFEAARAAGCEAVELDVHLTADGKLAVIHDDSVDRTTNGVGFIADLTLDDIQRLKVSGGGRVPSLEEVVDWAAGKTFLHVEIKARKALKPAVELLRARNVKGKCRVSSFWHDAVLQAKDLWPDCETGVLYSGSPLDHVRLATEARADALHPHRDYVTPGLVAAARAAKLSLTVWTVNFARDIERFHALGVDEIVTNIPETAFKVLNDLATRPSAAKREKTEEERRMDAERAAIQQLMKQKPGQEEGPRKPGRPPSW